MREFLAYVFVPLCTAVVIVCLVNRERIVRWLNDENDDDE